MLKIYLVGKNKDVYCAYKKYCEKFNFVSIYEGNILDLDVDTIVSPANSFGFMDGGIDAIYRDYFGYFIQEQLQTKIIENHFGELLVGELEVIHTLDNKIKYIIAIPTLRVPTILPDDSVNAYLATRSLFIFLKYGFIEDARANDIIKTIAIPGLCTGYGMMDAEKSAKQVCQAIEDILLYKLSFPVGIDEAINNHNFISK